MKLVEFVDSGAPEYVVTTIGEVKRISAGQVMITYVRRHEAETEASLHVIYDRDEYIRMGKLFVEMFSMLMLEMEQPWRDAAIALMHLN